MKSTDLKRQQYAARIAEFDILRSTAILLLFCHHGGIYNFSIGGFDLNQLNPFIEYFLLGSFVFMAGYLSVSSLDKWGLPRFLFTRLVRIYIPYLAALILFIILLQVNLSRTDLAIHLLGGQILLSPRFTTPVITLWFIGAILAYYTLFAVLYKSTRAFPVFILLAVMVFFLAFFARLEWGIIARRFFFYYLVYLIGVICAHTGWLQSLSSTRFFMLDKLILVGAGIGVLSGYRTQLLEGHFSLGMVLAIDLYILAMVLTALSIFRLITHWWPRPRIFSFIADASFFAYLFHRPIWQLLLEIYPAKTAAEYFIYLVILGSIIVLGLSSLMQHSYNRLAKLVNNRFVY